MNDSRDAHLMSGAYALHALDADERAEVEAAMVHSEELRGELAELSDTAVALGLAVHPEQPPAALRARLLDAIAELPQQPAVEDATDQPLPLALPAGRHRVPRRVRWYRRPAVLVGAAAAALLLFVGGLGVEHAVESTSDSARLAALTVAPDVHQAKSAVSGGGTATAYWSPSKNESAIVLSGVTTPSSGHVLQLWRIANGSAVSEGVYSPASGNDYEMLRGTLTAGQVYAVTVEPTGGSAQPTTQPIVKLAASA